MIAHSSASPKSYLFDLFFLNPLVALPDASVSVGPFTANLPNFVHASSVNDSRGYRIPYGSWRGRASRFLPS
jgi:hypothetical protein